MTRFHPAAIIPGSIRVRTVTMTWSDGTPGSVSTTTYITIQCSQCGHQFETHVGKYHETARCKSCNRLCAFSFNADVMPVNVVPLRRRA